MAITFDLLHSLGNILSIICSTQGRVAVPKLLICSQSMSSRLAALLLFNALIPFSRSSIWNSDVSMDFYLVGTWPLFHLPLVVVGEPPDLHCSLGAV